MRTSTVLSVAAALAASAFMAQAQVYSVNIVGYVNQVLPAGTQVAVANPLDNGTNDLDSVFGSLDKGSSANFWTGSGFSLATKGATAWAPNNPTPVGTGLFINSKTAITNTYVGQLVVNSGETVTNALPEGAQVLVGSSLPYAGTINTPELGLLALDKGSSANFWTGSGYTLVTKGATAWAPDQAINVGDGFFINSKTAVDWVQTAP
jgi:hypothetical protein